jgi:hypothetical protein
MPMCSRRIQVRRTFLGESDYPGHHGQGRRPVPRKAVFYLCGPRPVRLSETDARAASISINELDAGGLQGAANGQVVCRRHRSLIFGELRAPDGGDAQGRFSGEIFRTPSDESAGSSDLGAREWHRFWLTCIEAYAMFRSICYLASHRGRHTKGHFGPWRKL